LLNYKLLPDVAAFVNSGKHIKQQDPRHSSLSQSTVISSFIKSLSGIYINNKENSTYNLVIEFSAVHLPLGLFMG